MVVVVTDPYMEAIKDTPTLFLEPSCLLTPPAVQVKSALHEIDLYINIETTGLMIQLDLDALLWLGVSSNSSSKAC